MAGQVIAVLNMKGDIGKTTVSPHVMRVLYHNMLDRTPFSPDR
jgi:cellulose biosynthesis protein BcsQ